MFTRKILDEVNLSDLIRMADEGMTQREIAQAIGCAQSSINRFLKNYNDAKKGRTPKESAPKHAEPKKSFGERCAEELARRNGTAPIEAPRYNTTALRIVSKKTQLEGKVCNYTVDTITKRTTLQTRSMTGTFELTRDELNTLIEELKVLQAHLAE